MHQNSAITEKYRRYFRGISDFFLVCKISNIQKRQRVRINLKLEQDPLYAEIKTVGNEVDEVSKAIVCYATYTDQPKTLIVSNMFVDAEVILQTDTVLAVPKSAVIKSDTKHYVFVLENELDDKYLLKKLMLL